PGYYRVTVNYNTKNIKRGQQAGIFTIGRFNAPILHKLLYQAPLNPERNSLTAYIVFYKKHYTVQELRIWYAGQGSLAITSIQIERLNDLEQE
ncbi:MAG: hypothetical protein ACK4PR_08960, partial [Gammaproteobacteria bacterium]